MCPSFLVPCMGFYGGEREEFGGKLLGGHLHENVVGKHGGERRSGGIKRSGLRFYSLFFFFIFSLFNSND